MTEASSSLFVVPKILIWSGKTFFSLHHCQLISLATLRNKTKLAALNKEICEENPMSNLAQNTCIAKSEEDYIIQVSMEIEGKITKKLSKEFSRTESRILDDLSRIDAFLLSPLLQGHSGFSPETSQNAPNVIQATHDDDCQVDAHPQS